MPGGKKPTFVMLQKDQVGKNSFNLHILIRIIMYLSTLWAASISGNWVTQYHWLYNQEVLKPTPITTKPKPNSPSPAVVGLGGRYGLMWFLEWLVALEVGYLESDQLGVVRPHKWCLNICRLREEVHPQNVPFERIGTKATKNERSLTWL